MYDVLMLALALGTSFALGRDLSEEWLSGEGDRGEGRGE